VTFLKDNSLQSADKDQQEVRAEAENPHVAVVKFDTYRNLQRHRAVMPAIAQQLVNLEILSRYLLEFLLCLGMISDTHYLNYHHRFIRRRLLYV